VSSKCGNFDAIQ